MDKCVKSQNKLLVNTAGSNVSKWTNTAWEVLYTVNRKTILPQIILTKIKTVLKDVDISKQMQRNRGNEEVK